MGAAMRLVGSIPGIRLARRYEWRWLRFDLVAGAALAALLIPQGMAYAELAGVPPVAGLYTSVMALLAYAMFGPSPTLVIGPDSALAPMTAAAIIPLVVAVDDPQKRIELAATLTILIGIVCIAAGIARMGSLTELLSKPVRLGYLNGLAVIVITGQLAKLFGFGTDADGVLAKLRAFVDGVRSGSTVTEAMLIGVGSMVIIIGLRRWLPNVPGVLICVVCATLVTAAFDLVQRGVPVVGIVPSGFPRPALPTTSAHDIKDLLLPAVGIAFVALADSATVSRAFAKKGTTSDPTAEIIAVGAANIAVGLFQGIPVSASGGRSAVAKASGARSQMTGVVGALAILCILFFANGLLTNLPLAALSAIIICSAIRMFDYKSLVWMYRVRYSELLLSLAAFFGVVLFGVLEGIVIAVGLSLAAFIRKAWRPYSAVLGRVMGERGYHDIERRSDAIQIPGLLIYRFDAPLFFANADGFVRQVHIAIEQRGAPIRCVIVAAEPITDIDTTAAEAVVTLAEDLAGTGTTLVFAELKGPTRDRLRSYGFYDRIGDDAFFPTLGSAIDMYLATTGTPWVDWTEQDTTPSGSA